jgi:hypothetical protein
MSKVFHFDVAKVDLDVAMGYKSRSRCCGCYFRMLQMLFLTCCNRSSSVCNRFSFMFANRCTHVASVFLRCLRVPHANVLEKSVVLLGVANIKI